MARTYLFGAVHSVTPNAGLNHRAAFVAPSDVVPIDVPSINPGGWNYFYVDNANAIAYGKQANPAYNVDTNPGVPQYIPLSFESADKAEAAYAALV